MLVLSKEIATVVISLGALSCFAQGDSHRGDIDRYLRPYVQSKNFSGAVLVAKDGKEVFKRAYGFANREKRVRNTTETRFHIASVSMQFTAAAVLRLIDADSIKSDERVGTLVSGIEGADKITVSRPPVAALGAAGHQWPSRLR